MCSMIFNFLVSALQHHAIIVYNNRMEKLPVHPTMCKALLP